VGGRDGIRRFFRAIGGLVESRVFKVHRYVEWGEDVVTLGYWQVCQYRSPVGSLQVTSP